MCCLCPWCMHACIRIRKGDTCPWMPNDAFGLWFPLSWNKKRIMPGDACGFAWMPWQGQVTAMASCTPPCLGIPHPSRPGACSSIPLTLPYIWIRVSVVTTTYGYGSQSSQQLWPQVPSTVGLQANHAWRRSLPPYRRGHGRGCGFQASRDGIRGRWEVIFRHGEPKYIRLYTFVHFIHSVFLKNGEQKSF